MLYAISKTSSVKWTPREVTTLDDLTRILASPLPYSLSASHMELCCLTQGPERRGDQTASAHCASQRKGSHSEKAAEQVTFECFYSEVLLMYTKKPLYHQAVIESTNDYFFKTQAI